MSQWAEIRHLHFVDGVPKKQIARRLGVDPKTVRRALERTGSPGKRLSPPRGRRLDPWHDRIVDWLRLDPKLTAKRIGKLLREEAGRIPERTVREYVAKVRRDLYPPEAFVHRTASPGARMEADFGESWAVVAGDLVKVHYLVVTLPCSNAYWAKAYRTERLECLLDGLSEAFSYFGGIPETVVFDNTSLAVKRVLAGREREETDSFHTFRGAWPFRAEYCAPAKGWEKGSVETGVKYVRNLVFRPMPSVESVDELNGHILCELEEDLDERTLPGGRSAREALEEERRALRPLPVHRPETCRRQSRVADKFGHVRVDRVTYSVPIELAYRPVWAKLYPERVVICAGNEVAATHERSYEEGANVLEALHVLPLLEKKHRAVGEATAIRQWKLPLVFGQLRAELVRHTRKPDQEWVRVLRLMETHSEEEVTGAVTEALRQGSPRLETVRLLLRQQTRVSAPPVEPVHLARTDLAALTVPAPSLAAYDSLWRVH